MSQCRLRKGSRETKPGLVFQSQDVRENRASSCDPRSRSSCNDVVQDRVQESEDRAEAGGGRTSRRMEDDQIKSSS